MGQTKKPEAVKKPSRFRPMKRGVGKPAGLCAAYFNTNPVFARQLRTARPVSCA